jgi:DNA-binding NarL/FixJ family response regulator
VRGIVDGQRVFRRVARDVLEVRGCAVAGEAVDLQTALEALAHLASETALIDVRLGAEGAFNVARALTRGDPALSVLMVSPRTRYRIARPGSASAAPAVSS